MSIQEAKDRLPDIWGRHGNAMVRLRVSGRLDPVATCVPYHADGSVSCAEEYHASWECVARLATTGRSLILD